MTENKKPNSTIYTNRWALKPEYLRALQDINASFVSVQERKAVQEELVVKDGVGIINVTGIITPYSDFYDWYFGATSIESMRYQFDQALSDRSVKGIVFNFHSPGGDVTGVHEFAEYIKANRTAKPIVAYASGLCASAAYWIATGCQVVYASKTASVGSIGVVASWIDDSKLLDDIGVKIYEVVNSESPDKRIDLKTDEGLTKLKEELNALAKIFFGSVADNRGYSIAHVKENFGKGGVLLADEGKKVGMIDGVSSLDKIITKLNKGGRSIMAENVKAEDIVDDKEEKDKETKTEVTDDKKDDKEKESKKAVDETDDKEKDKENDTEASMNMYLKGVQDERKRIEGLMDIAPIQGMTDIIKRAMFVEPVTAGDLALKLLKAERAEQSDMLAKYKADAGNIPDISRSAGSDVNSDTITHQKNVDIFKQTLKGE